MNMSNFIKKSSFKPAKVDKKIFKEFKKTSGVDEKFLKNKKLKNDYYYTYANFHKKTKQIFNHEVQRLGKAGNFFDLDTNNKSLSEYRQQEGYKDSEAVDEDKTTNIDE